MLLDSYSKEDSNDTIFATYNLNFIRKNYGQNFAPDTRETNKPGQMKWWLVGSTIYEVLG